MHVIRIHEVNFFIVILSILSFTVSTHLKNIPESKFEQHEDVLQISVSRAQHLYNDKVCQEYTIKYQFMFLSQFLIKS